MRFSASIFSPLFGAMLILPGWATAAPAGPITQRAVDTSIVTPTRTPREPRQTLAPTTVITRADIERLQAQSVRELLRRSPGINITNQGGPGKLTSIFLRGTESDHVLVLVDGVRYGDATSGIPAIQDLPVSQIERIEIVRGPRSSLYGADAIGGVIQIFTRKGANEPQPYFSVTGSRYDTYEGQAGVSGGGERSSYHVGVSGTQSDGFDACNDPAGCFVDEPDDDGYDRLAGSLRADYRFDNGVQLNVNALRTQADTEFDGPASNESETLRQLFGFSLAGRPLEDWQVKLSLGRNLDEANGFLNGDFNNTFDTQRNTAALQNDITVGANQLVTFGLDYRREKIVSSTEFTENSRDNAGIFLQYLGGFGRNNLQLALRGDDNEQFGDNLTGSATYGFDITERYTATASYGTAFKAPTFNELYFPDFFGFPTSNPDLDPAESESYELGFIGKQDWGRWSLNAYETQIDDLIVLDASFVPQNIAESRLRGIEAEAGAAFGAWSINGNASWLDAEVDEGPGEGNELPRRPEYTAQLDVDRSFLSRFSAGASLFVADATFDDTANTRELGSYELVELRGEMRLTPDWRVQARIANLLDEDYETVDFFNQPGRSLFVTLRYQPQ